MNEEEKIGKELAIEEKAKVGETLKIFAKKNPIKSLTAEEVIDELHVEDIHILKKELEKDRAKNHYIEYLQYVHKNFIPTNFHRFLADVCEAIVKRVESGKTVKVIISTPPRHGKSTTVTETLPTWFVGRNPDSKCILTAHNADLAERFGESNRKIARENWKEIFGLEISATQDTKKIFSVKNHAGAIASFGIDGGITGNGGRLIIVDDPYKNEQEADSSLIRNAIEETFKKDVLTRREGFGTAIIIIHTRWNEDDLAGIYSKKGWMYINIPCICDSKDDVLHRKIGESLCPELGFTPEVINETRQDIGERAFSALYQGKPVVDSGNIIKSEWIKYYKKGELPPSFDNVTQSWDLTFNDGSNSDFVAGQVWGKKGANFYLIKRIKKRLDFTKTCDTIKLISYQYPEAYRKLVERKANGDAVINTLQSVIGGFIPIIPKESKVGRLNAVAPIFESGNVFLPDKEIDQTIGDMVEELTKFPYGSHDDEVDACSQYLSEERKYDKPTIVIDSNIVKIRKVFSGSKL